MGKKRKSASREIGLELGCLYNKYFLKSEHLHYGYWTSDIEVDIMNLHIAQENYVKLLISHIPDGVRKILDVGCGTGGVARRLIAEGYQVDCVSPSPFLSKHARDLLGDTSHIFENLYEKLETQNRYDLILFSESFQYIDTEEAIKKTLGFLNPDGYMLICDVFKKDVLDKSVLKGGHLLPKFYDIISKYPFEPVEDLDITEQTAPTLDITNELFTEVLEPTINLGQRLLHDKHPIMLKCIKFLYRKRIDKVSKKYFSGEKTGENFKKFKSYRLLLYRKVNPEKA